MIKELINIVDDFIAERGYELSETDREWFEEAFKDAIVGDQS